MARSRIASLVTSLACLSAACSSSSSAPATGESGGTGGAGGASGSGGAAAGAGGSSLAPVPTGTYPGCEFLTAPGDAGVISCCTYLQCYSPEVGAACLPAPAMGVGAIASGTAPICVSDPASKLCGCGAVRGPFAGPYVDGSQFADPAIQCANGGGVGTVVSPYQNGSCCYLVPLLDHPCSG